MLSLRTSFLVFAGIFVLIAGLATLGNFAQASGVRSEAWLSLTSKIVFIGLAVALAFAFVPLMVNVVFGAQSALGNEARLAPLFALRVTIIWVLWTLMGLGSIVGVAAAARAARSLSRNRVRSRGRRARNEHAPIVGYGCSRRCWYVGTPGIYATFGLPRRPFTSTFRGSWPANYDRFFREQWGGVREVARVKRRLLRPARTVAKGVVQKKRTRPNAAFSLTSESSAAD